MTAALYLPRSTASTEADPERSERFGVPVPIPAERQRLKSEGVEHINVNGDLEVPVARSLDPAPPREGWEPRFVSINLEARPQKWVTYRRPKTAQQ